MRHLKALEDKGYIQRDSKARSIRIVDKKQVYSQHSDNIVQFHKKSSLIPQTPAEYHSDAAEFVPLIGQVAAGQPIAALENIEDYIPISKNMLSHRPGSFLLRVRGDSMKDGIQPGDLILVTPGLAVNRSDIVVAVIEDEATVKRYYPEADRVILRADNPSYSDIIVSHDLRLAGKVTGLIRQY